ncbi:restriction endonuclease [Bradyrhizobium sp. CCBAU 11361]|nr:restriction endonuclease [Bradyrhizobium sp. CCBAU 11361]
MTHTIVVREYARLTADAVETPSLDCACITPSAFDWLCDLMSRFSKSGAALCHLENRRWLRLDNYVGVLETPCGTRLEILPKHYNGRDSIARSRALLRKMIQSSLDLPVREAGQADLQLFDAPLSEWLIGKFLLLLDDLVKRGIRFDYQRVEEEQVFLRGQLDVAKQIRQPPSRRHHFQIRHDIFLADMPENRLLKSALEATCKSTQDARNWRLAHELRSLLQQIPASTDIGLDLDQWRDDRLQARYQAIKPWCELILRKQMPIALSHEWQGISLLFPMEKLYERYVAACLRKMLRRDASLKLGSRLHHLCEHDGGKIFRLEPDFLVSHAGKNWILDAKWKQLDAANRADSYNLQQSDFYQLFAYGNKYLHDQQTGELVLIYPKVSEFSTPLPHFDFTKNLRLWVLPLDLELGVLNGITRTNLPLSSNYTDAIAV